MCPCDKQTGHVCCRCREAIRKDGEIMPSHVLRRYHGDWKVDAVAGAEVSA